MSPRPSALTPLDASHISLRCLAAFVAVVEHGGFRKAAPYLYMDASTASKLIRQLEAELGEVLLLRTTRQVVLTPQGRAALGIAKRLLRDARKLMFVVGQEHSLTGT